MPEGLIIKALSGYYYVLAEDGMTIQCRARGVFRNKGISPLVGDHVVYSLTENGEGTVEALLPRSTELIRPPIANVNLALLVFSLLEPALNLQLLDKFLVHTEEAGLNTVICLSKLDLLHEGECIQQSLDAPWQQIKDMYENIGYQVIITSTKTGIGTEEIAKALSGSISVVAGQSGAGKSSLINAIIPGLQLETKGISVKLGRGKHTTRHVELIPLQHGGLVADTPGFSQLDFNQLEAGQLSDCFREFRPYVSQCKFRGCLHSKEPGCSVINAMEQGVIAASRYAHYLVFINEIQERKRRY